MALPTITAIGNLTFDPDFQVTANGISRCRLRIACNERKKQDGEWVDGEPTFLDVTLWRGLAEAAGDNFKKGQSIMVTGKLKVRNYEDKNGKKATAVEIEATDIAAVVKPSKSASAPTDAVRVQAELATAAPYKYTPLIIASFGRTISSCAVAMLPVTVPHLVPDTFDFGL